MSNIAKKLTLNSLFHQWTSSGITSTWLTISFKLNSIIGKRSFQIVLLKLHNFRSKLVEEAGLIVINFHAIYSNETMEAVMKKWEHAVLDYALNITSNDEYLKLYVTSEGLVSEEVRRTGKILAVTLQSEVKCI